MPKSEKFAILSAGVGQDKGGLDIVTQADKKQSKRHITVAQRKSGQEKRLAEQLRANLLKRKAQARQRKAVESEDSD
ncbi:hypothetical protein [Candidatus Tokpelaia sp.]|uniref:hypothetical protein n=1 Tax=Candidatus Tokpelaia sp. TaxID=2233777 RepID=UPI00123C1FF0|nr:hypothetical protein [Candidatus Tokpelaia sp.]KAA6406115.1 hypothetical protein DPQ22_01400 [Candidatus Tokpelaia sp.]